MLRQFGGGLLDALGVAAEIDQRIGLARMQPPAAQHGAAALQAEVRFDRRDPGIGGEIDHRSLLPVQQKAKADIAQRCQQSDPQQHPADHRRIDAAMPP
ncbi:MAG TPA: hypothetical protein VEY92_08995 [Pseudoxanthomonas sp.]|nr:hypothetical protein [Pseudoxanthomonas sp.]